MRAAGIVGLGLYLPERTQGLGTEDDAAETSTGLPADFIELAVKAAETDPRADPGVARHKARETLEAVRSRHLIAPGDRPSALEIGAARLALQDAGRAPEDVDLLMVYSALPDSPFPLNHARVAHALGLNPAVTAFSLATGSASFVTQLTLASRLVASGASDCALIVQGSAMSRVVDPRQPSAAMAGDAGSAAVIAPVAKGHGLLGSEQRVRGELHAGVQLQGPDGAAWYAGQGPLSVQVGDSEAAKLLGIKSVAYCEEVSRPLLALAGQESVKVFATSHPTTWFADECARSLGLSADSVVCTAESLGHMMACNVPANLWQARSAGRLRAGDLALLYSPGLGLIQAAALVRWC